MERIVIEVNEATARKWRKTSSDVKSRLEKIFEKHIDLATQKDKEERFEKLLDKARKEAAENGLTEEILEKLLNEE